MHDEFRLPNLRLERPVLSLWESTDNASKDHLPDVIYGLTVGISQLSAYKLVMNSETCKPLLNIIN